MKRCLLLIPVLLLGCSSDGGPSAPAQPSALPGRSVVGLWHAQWRETSCQGTLDFNSACEEQPFHESLLREVAAPPSVRVEIERQEGQTLYGHVYFFHTHAVTPFVGSLDGDIVRIDTTRVYADGQVNGFLSNFQFTMYGPGSFRLTFRGPTYQGNMQLTGRASYFDKCDC